MISELRPDRILTLESFVEILEAVDLKVKMEPNNDRIKKIQGALGEILTKAHKFESYKKPYELFPMETFINLQIVTGQQSKLAWTTEMRNLIV